MDALKHQKSLIGGFNMLTMWVESPGEYQTRIRIKLTMAAYAYEYLNRIIMSDSSFDILCQKVDLKINTKRPDLDEWWRKNFSPHTGMWIRSHPEIALIGSRFSQIYSDKALLFTKKTIPKKKPAKVFQGELF